MSVDPARLADAKTRLRAAGEAVFALDAASGLRDVRAAHTRLRDACDRLHALTDPPPPPRPPAAAPTGCARHPAGPVDPDPETGWGDCLLCNTARRRANPARRPEGLTR
ncbi:hypothetical protein ACIRLA_46615 [Streptomyces sp. NPDC102364]|uniref:hypothetical protein n=1 Tax=Streptomyces sp. NPDC102364 TaxID=3366161 RepID=UPI00381FD22B